MIDPENLTAIIVNVTKPMREDPDKVFGAAATLASIIRSKQASFDEIREACGMLESSIAGPLLDKTERALEEEDESVPPLMSPPTPLAVGRHLINCNQVRVQGGFYPGSFSSIVQDEDRQFYRWTDEHRGWECVGADLGILPLEFLEGLHIWDPVNKKQKPFGDTMAHRKMLLGHTLNAVTPKVDLKAAPHWAATDVDPPYQMRDIIVTRNGVLDMSTMTLFPHTPGVFTLNRCPVDYIPGATCYEWNKVIENVAPDKEAQDLIQEWFGYCLTNREPWAQKAFWLFGQPRSGKGTILRIFQEFFGNMSTAAEFSLLANAHGLEPLIGKRLVTFPDVKIGRPSQIALGRLLSIIGNDDVMINPKHKTMTGVRLTCKVMFASNQVPRDLADEYGALASRLLFFETVGTFQGKEDYTLESRLLRDELPGILNWGLTGLQRLQKRGRFLEPESSKKVKASLQARSSDVSMFFKETFDFTGRVQDTVAGGLVFEKYKTWCDNNDIQSQKRHSRNEVYEALLSQGGVQRAIDDLGYSKSEFPKMTLTKGRPQVVAFPGVVVKAKAPSND